jgi:cell division protein FtsL
MRSEKVFYSFATIGFIVIAVSFISAAKSLEDTAVVTTGEFTVNDHRDIIEYVDNQIISGLATGYVISKEKE